MIMLHRPAPEGENDTYEWCSGPACRPWSVEPEQSDNDSGEKNTESIRSLMELDALDGVTPVRLKIVTILSPNRVFCLFPETRVLGQRDCQ